jgi:hypothetical protein
MGREIEALNRRNNVFHVNLKLHIDQLQQFIVLFEQFKRELLSFLVDTDFAFYCSNAKSFAVYSHAFNFDLFFENLIWRVNKNFKKTCLFVSQNDISFEGANN